MLIRLIAAVLLSGMAAAMVRAADTQKAEQAVADKLKELKGEAKPALIKDESVEKALPGVVLFSVRFPLYPVARVPPEPLKSQNLFAVGADGKAKLITDSKGVEDLFRTSAAAVTDEKTAKDAGLAWLLLTEELAQDGYYKFKTVEEATKIEDDKGGKKVTVKAVVMAGGNGEIVVTLTFGKDGKLATAAEKVELKAGPRPRCHATKLLDPDPVVRAIVEDDLLFMGQAAKDYLDEQRSKANPELQQAIDRIWHRILAEER